MLHSGAEPVGGDRQWMIGRADRPEEQRQPPFALSARNEVTLLIGGPEAGLAEAIRTIATSRALGAAPDDLHLYVIDQLGQGLACLGDLPHTGAAATRNDPLARRILDHLAQEVSRRRALLLESAASSVEDLARRGVAPPRLLLVVHGCDRLLLYGEAASSPLLPPLLALTGEIGGVGIEVILSGSPSIAHHRLGSQATRRLVFRVADPQEYSVLGVPPAARPALHGPMRGFDSSTGTVVQVARLADRSVGTEQVLECLGEELQNLVPVSEGRRPVMIRDVGWPLPWSQVSSCSPPSELVSPIAAAVDVNSGELLWLDGEEDGPVVAVTGTSQSGRSSALLAAGRVARQLGQRVIGVSLSRRSPLASGVGIAVDELVSPAHLSGMRLDLDRPILVLIDDIHRWSGGVESLEKLLAYDRTVPIVVSGSTDYFGSRNDVTRA
ncbi:MAG: FtsK/SpoIIIE domain-containing protein, partial [Nocardioidaceae bacterium]